MVGRVSVLSLAAAGMLLDGRTAWAGGDDTTREACVLADGRGGMIKGRLVTVRDENMCGGDGCFQRESITVYAAKKRLLAVGNNLGDSSPSDPEPVDRPLAALKCEDGIVRLNSATQEPAVDLHYDAKLKRLRVADTVKATVEKSWELPANGDRAEQREKLAGLLDDVLAGDDRDTNDVGIERALSDTLWLSVARDKLNADAWERAETILERLGGGDAPLSRALEERRAKVRAQLAEARRATVPIRVLEQRRLGATLTPPALPIDAGVAPTLFWRGGELCAVQEEDPPKDMRCYTPETKRWGARVPMVLPASDGRQLRRWDMKWTTRCEGSNVVQKRIVDPHADTCAGLGANREALLGVVDGDAMLLQLYPEMALDRGAQEPQKLSTKAGVEIARRTAGSLVVGDGCCRFRLDGRVELMARNNEKVWDVRGALPQGQRWLKVPPLVSPDERWAVAQSGTGAEGDTRVGLWLLRLERAK